MLSISSHQRHPVRAHRGHPTVLQREEIPPGWPGGEPAESDVPPECTRASCRGDAGAPVHRQDALHLHQRYDGAP